MALNVRTISDQLFEIVRERILSGALKAGDPIRQDALAAELGVSKIPLREALARLDQCGLLTPYPNRGFVVRPMSASELEDIYALRLKLEPEAVALGAERADETEHKQAVTALTAFKKDAALRRVSGGTHNRALHLALIRPCRMDVTTSILERLHVLADRYVCKHLEPLGRNKRADREHDEIVKAWLARDKTRVEKLMREHITGTIEDLRKQISNQEGGAKTGEKKAAAKPRSRKHPTGA